MQRDAIEPNGCLRVRSGGAMALRATKESHPTLKIGRALSKERAVTNPVRQRLGQLRHAVAI